MNSRFLPLSLMVPALFAVSFAQAQAPYPAKPVRLIVPYPPGGTTDFVGREIAHKIGELIGQQMVVDNRPGAGSLIGVALGAKAAPDGYTITFGTSAGLAVNPALGVKMSFDPLRDFVPIGLIVYAPFLLVVHPALPVRNVKEFVALARAHPGKLNFASPGVGTPNHLGIELLSIVGGVKFVHVPYKGGSPAVTDLIAGQVQALFTSTPQVSAFLKTGRLKALAVGTQAPTPVVPGMPTIAQTFPGFDCNTWFGLLAPTGTAAAIVTRLNTELNRALGDATVAQRLLEQGLEAMPGTPAMLRERIVSETERWRKVIKAAGITPEAAQ